MTSCTVSSMSWERHRATTCIAVIESPPSCRKDLLKSMLASGKAHARATMAPICSSKDVAFPGLGHDKVSSSRNNCASSKLIFSNHCVISRRSNFADAVNGRLLTISHLDGIIYVGRALNTELRIAGKWSNPACPSAASKFSKRDGGF